MSEAPPAVRLRGITKTYPGVRANDGVDLDVLPGSIHGLLGENGAGKSTLMKILFGLVEPDAGVVEIDGVAQRFRSPADALAAGVGMVQQHFSLVDDFTVTENLVLGHEPRRRGLFLDRARADDEVQALCDRFGFRLDARRHVGELAVGARQRVEILKALHRGAKVLILDEPTAALAPQEADELFVVLEGLRAEGRTIVFISHRLPEVIRLCDRVTVLRDGRSIGQRTNELHERAPGGARDALEAELARLMVGRPLPAPPPAGGTPGPPLLRLDGAGDGASLGPIDLEVCAGEIVGIAGVEGNGQTELVELVLGVRPCRRGRMRLRERDVTTWSVRRRLGQGIAHIAEDRHAAGIALDLPVADNAVLGFEGQRPFARGALWLSRPAIVGFARDLVARFRVRTSSVAAPANSLSGGNQQKLVVGREMARHPALMVAAQPTRGLDVGATAFVHQELAALRDGGCAVLLVSLDLTEVLTLADRVVVFSQGRVAGTVRADQADPIELGRWMTGGRAESAA